MNQNQVQQTLTSHTFTHSTPKQRIGLEPNIQILFNLFQLKYFWRKKVEKTKAQAE